MEILFNYENILYVGYPNSLLRPRAEAVAALPPLYFLAKSSLMRSRNAIGICLPADSMATTQYATIQSQ